VSSEHPQETILALEQAVLAPWYDGDPARYIAHYAESRWRIHAFGSTGTLGRWPSNSIPILRRGICPSAGTAPRCIVVPERDEGEREEGPHHDAQQP
jgi:hypothetical protein